MANGGVCQVNAASSWDSIQNFEEIQMRILLISAAAVFVVGILNLRCEGPYDIDPVQQTANEISSDV